MLQPCKRGDYQLDHYNHQNHSPPPLQYTHYVFSGSEGKQPCKEGKFNNFSPRIKLRESRETTSLTAIFIQKFHHI